MTRLRQGYGAAAASLRSRRWRRIGARRRSASCAAPGRSADPIRPVTRLMARGVGERPSCSRRARWRRGAVARCVADARARRLHPVAGSTRCRVADLRAGHVGADGAAGRGVRAGCDLLADADRRRGAGAVGVRDRAAAGRRHGRRHGGDPHRDESDRAVPGRAADERHADGGALAGGDGAADRAARARSRWSSDVADRRLAILVRPNLAPLALVLAGDAVHPDTARRVRSDARPDATIAARCRAWPCCCG